MAQSCSDDRGRCKKTKLVVMERYLWLYLFLQHVMMATNKMHRKIPTEQVCVNPASRLRALSYKAPPAALVARPLRRAAALKSTHSAQCIPVKARFNA